MDYKNREEFKKFKVIGFDDLAFKKIFKKHINLLNYLVSLVTGIDFSNDKFELIDSELDDGIDIKGSRCDLHIKVKNNIYYDIDVETQQYYLRKDEYYDRAIFTACKMYTSLHDFGEKYDGNKQAIVIYFYNDKYDKYRQDDVPFLKTQFVDYNLDIPITHNNIIIYRINVKAALKKGFDEKMKDGKILLEILSVLSTFKVDDYVGSRNGAIHIMADEIRKMNVDEKEKMRIFLRELHEGQDRISEGYAYRDGLEKGIEQGIEKGIEQGIEKGIEQGTEQTISRDINLMFEAGLSAEKIADILKLDIEDVNKRLKKNEA